MTNVEMSTEGHVLTIKVDLSKRLGRSKSGKTIIVATTGGNITVPGAPDVKLGLNLYTHG
jgi:hypothetical protein